MNVWEALWNWLARHDSFAGALVTVGLGGMIAWLARRAKQARDEQADMQEWRDRIDRELAKMTARIDRNESSIHGIVHQLREFVARMGRIDERHEQAEKRSQMADERILAQLDRTNRQLDQVISRNREVDRERESGPD